MNNQFAFSLQSPHIILYTLLAALALVISWWSYRHVSGYSKIRKYTLVGFRTAGIALIGILLLEPLMTVFGQKTTGDKLGVLIDLSSSMNIQNNGRPRWVQAESVYTRLMPANIAVKYYGFSDTLIKLDELPDSTAFSGKATDLSLALSLPFEEANEDIGALLVVTDGAANIGQDPLKTASMLNMPVYSLVAGGVVSRKDVYISQINYQPIAYINTETAIQAEFGANGYSGQFAQLEIRDNRKVLASRRVTLPADGALATEEFKLIINEDGVKYLQANITDFADEAYKDNNSRHFVIKFLKDKIRVLMLSAVLNWEYTFLKRVLESDQHISLQAVIGNRQGNFDPRDMPLPPEGWGKQDLVIIINTNARALGSQINELRTAIKAKTGFLFIAGADSRMIQLNTWTELLPFTMNIYTNIVPGEYFPLSMENPRAKAILGIEGLNWAQLPPLQYLVGPVESKSDGWLLMDAESAAKNRWPVIVAGTFGQGKIAAILGYPLWPRLFRGSTNSVDPKLIKQFWGNLVRWLVTRDDIEKFNIATDKPVYKLGEPVTFAATLFDDNYNLIGGGKIKVTIADSSGVQRELQLSGEQPGKYTGDFGSPAPGDYSFKAVATRDNDTLGQRQGTFLVESTSLEMENPSANYTLMQKIAEVTGGKSFDINDFGQFPKSLNLKIQKSEIFTEHRPINSLYILLLGILFLSAEWAIRKFSQLP